MSAVVVGGSEISRCVVNGVLRANGVTSQDAGTFAIFIVSRVFSGKIGIADIVVLLRKCYM